MRAGLSAWCGVALGVVSATGCAPFFAGEAGPASPEGQGSVGVYRGPERVAAGEGMYAGLNGPAPVAVEVSAGPARVGTDVPVVAGAFGAEGREPLVVVVRGPGCCSGPVVVTVACAGGSGGAREVVYENDAPPPAPYKPWPYEGTRAPPLYHDR
jgi:hypothetical protein